MTGNPPTLSMVEEMSSPVEQEVDDSLNAALVKMGECGATVRNEELEEALCKLQSRDQVDEGTVAVLDTLATRLVVKLLEPVVETVDEGLARDDIDAVRAACLLFGERDSEMISNDEDTTARDALPELDHPHGVGVQQ